MASVATGGPAERQRSTTARRALILGPPLVVAVYEIFHPMPDVNAAAVMDVAGWFALFHAIQLVLFPLLVLSIALMAQNLGVLGRWATRLGLVLMLVFFSAYDAIAGITTGLAMRASADLSVAGQNTVFDVVKDWPGFDPAVFRDRDHRRARHRALADADGRRSPPQVGRGPLILLALATIAALGGHPFPFEQLLRLPLPRSLWLERRGYGTAQHARVLQRNSGREGELLAGERLRERGRNAA